MTVEPFAIRDRIKNDYLFHQTNEDQRRDMDSLRAAIRNVALLVVRVVPPGREQSTALTKLEEALFHANAGIAREPTKPDGII